MKYLRRFFFGYIIFFLILLLVEAWARYAQVNFSISFFFYWMYLFAFIMAIFIWKLSSNFSLKLSFVLILCGVLFFAVGVSNVSEVLLRLAFVGWLVGMIQALIEYGKDNIAK